MYILSQIWFQVQNVLFPFLEKEYDEPLTDKLKEVVAVLEFISVEQYVFIPRYQHGRYPKNRVQIIKSFVAKAIYNMDTTRQLIDILKTNPSLRRICGWEKASDIPHESSFSRVFAELAESELPQRIHEAIIKQHVSPRIVGHISRDSTAIPAREKPVRKEKTKKSRAAKLKAKRGRPRKGEKRQKPLTRLERQQNMKPNEMIEDLPQHCDVGTKKNSKGYKETWTGYKLHIDAADGQIPVSCILTSASLHDSQAALPLAAMSDQRVDNLYDLMDAAYDSPIIRDYSEQLGHVPIIDINPRRNKKLKQEIADEKRRQAVINFTTPERIRFKERSNVERVNGRLKDEYGGKKVRVRGNLKVMAHLMFGIIALTVDQLIKLTL